MLFTVLALGLFLLGAVAFAIDMGSLWFARQSAQTAADAACTAGAMDLLVDATNGAMPKGANFTPGAQFDCSPTTTSSPSPCRYAQLNGYSSSITQGSAISGTLGDNVSVDFPQAADVGLTGLNLPPSSVTSNPLIRVQVLQNIPTFFARFLGITQQKMGATAICAVEEADSPIPILVLNPTVSSALSLGGGGGKKQTGNIQIVGGPSKSVQVNSQHADAVDFKGGPTVNLCQAGGNYCGSAMGVWGGPTATPSNFVTSCKANNLCKSPATQQIPQWNVPSPPIADPYASTPPPQLPKLQPDAKNWNGVGHPQVICAQGAKTCNPPDLAWGAGAVGTHGCPDPNGCYEYRPGYYPAGICVGNGNCPYKNYSTAIFDSGVYYMASKDCNNGNGSFCVESQSCVRPSTEVGDGSRGTVFYFSDTNSVFVGANAGGQGCTGLSTFDPRTTVSVAGGQLEFGAGCDATSLAGISTLVNNGVMTVPFNGSVLLAPCQKPTVQALCDSAADASAHTNCDYTFGDPLGTNDPIGEQRGILFFQNRTVNATTNPNWGGGGSMLLAGSMYFHQCVSGGTDSAGLGCDNTTFNDTFNLGGSSGSSTYVLGDIITDQLFLQGNTAITMNLNPTSAFTVLKAALVQ